MTKDYYGIIYKITNKLNKKIYIGQTICTLGVRWCNHVHDSKYKDYKMSRAIRKYGKDNFIVEEIEKCASQEELNEREVYWIKFYNSIKCGYNSSAGGDANPMCSEETKRKLSKAFKGKKRNFTEEQRKQYAERVLINGKQFKSGVDHINRRSVVQLDLNLNYIKTFNTIVSAEDLLIRKRTGKIGHAIKTKGTSSGYFWMYEDQYLVNKNNLSEYFHKTTPKGVLIVQLTLDNVFIKVWNSIKEAEIFLTGKQTTVINAAIKKNCMAYGYNWITKEQWDREYGLEATLNTVIR